MQSATLEKGKIKEVQRPVPFTKPKNVADYVALQVAISGKTQREIAEEAGFENANMISMIKKNLSKVPLARIKPIAQALNIDKVFFMQMVLQEYYPDVWESIESVLGQKIITDNEYEIIKVIRSVNKLDPKITTQAKEKLKEFAASL